VQPEAATDLLKRQLAFASKVKACFVLGGQVSKCPMNPTGLFFTNGPFDRFVNGRGKRPNDGLLGWRIGESSFMLDVSFFRVIGALDVLDLVIQNPQQPSFNLLYLFSTEMTELLDSPNKGILHQVGQAYFGIEPFLHPNPRLPAEHVFKIFQNLT
jgi:hypothetical protein